MLTRDIGLVTIHAPESIGYGARSMRILHLTTEFPWPAVSGGSVRTVSQLKLLASLPEVAALTTVSVAEKGVSAEDRRAFADAVPKLRVVPPVFHPVHLFDFPRHVPRVVVLRALRQIPYLAGKWDSPRLRAVLSRELTDGAPDVVYVDHLGMARYLPTIRAACPRARVVLDQHNVESDFFAQFAARQRGPKKLVARAEHRASVAFEKRALRDADAVVAISPEDAAHFERLAGVRAHVVPVVVSFERRDRPDPGRPHFCYVGNLRWQPNVAGLDWFCQEVWPLVRARVPEATFEIAGTGLERHASTGETRAPGAWRVPGVTTTGFLEDLEPLYARSRGMLAPIIGGSGVRMKLLEGFRAGVPVVTTPDGALGLPIADRREALVASDPEGFADRVAELATTPALAGELRARGFDYLDQHHSTRVAQSIARRVLGVPS